jgi:hypothetical protein
VAGFARAARAGLQVGRGQAGARIPASTPASLVPRLEHLTHDVFAGAYVTAMHPTLALSVAILIGGAAACLLLRRTPAAGTPGAHAASPLRQAASAAPAAASAPIPATTGNQITE